MEDIGLLITIFFLITLGPPALFLILGFVKRNRSPNTARIFFILAAAWILIGGGICATILA